ncbi:hypothetical protein [Photorhabdus bodei]|uniref:Uncharacterized protein n=1 Tax=Photorhabdus bodei TaxID=2029681 RepID=A0A329X2W6_9GAMM|nr:hypothetical protein [Photorhabdus bodei]NDK99694.1 hypothetical protein [Photorhabdus bodei]NDL04778.1 hypothetical protein [Photorhabdus bodei]NDL08416.1 hypothetical protein [Photorhabdus bodei]RAX11249.1 hypothetical protein CKY02_13745 [Photorhabdus bodei]
MGWELHITRAECFSMNEDCQISSDEWLALVAEDDELFIDERNGRFHARWTGKSVYEEPWLNWSDGNIHTKHPDTALYCKMLQIAEKLNAKVVDDDDHLYLLPTDLENPSWVKSNQPEVKKSFLQKLMNYIKR